MPALSHNLWLLHAVDCCALHHTVSSDWKMLWRLQALAAKHYAEHDGKPFFPKLINFLSSTMRPTCLSFQVVAAAAGYLQHHTMMHSFWQTIPKQRHPEPATTVVTMFRDLLIPGACCQALR
jgi:protein-S-isoprenylcysteine O-methyltransferase Ste14